MNMPDKLTLGKWPEAISDTEMLEIIAKLRLDDQITLITGLCRSTAYKEVIGWSWVQTWIELHVSTLSFLWGHPPFSNTEK